MYGFRKPWAWILVKELWDLRYTGGDQVGAVESLYIGNDGSERTNLIWSVDVGMLVKAC